MVLAEHVDLCNGSVDDVVGEGMPSHINADARVRINHLVEACMHAPAAMPHAAPSSHQSQVPMNATR